MAQRKGRPPSENPKNQRLFIRVTPDEKKYIQDFARRENISLLELIKKGIEAVEK